MAEKGEERLYVSRILNSRLEEIRDLTFDEIEALPSEIEFAVLPATTVYGKSVNPDVVDDAYRIALQSASGKVYIDDVDTDIKKVSVEITWMPTQRSYPVSMSTATYVSRDGVSRR